MSAPTTNARLVKHGACSYIHMNVNIYIYMLVNGELFCSGHTTRHNKRLNSIIIISMTSFSSSGCFIHRRRFCQSLILYRDASHVTSGARADTSSCLWSRHAVLVRRWRSLSQRFDSVACINRTKFFLSVPSMSCDRRETLPDNVWMNRIRLQTGTTYVMSCSQSWIVSLLGYISIKSLTSSSEDVFSSVDCVLN